MMKTYTPIYTIDIDGEQWVRKPGTIHIYREGEVVSCSQEYTFTELYDKITQMDRKLEVVLGLTARLSGFRKTKTILVKDSWCDERKFTKFDKATLSVRFEEKEATLQYILKHVPSDRAIPYIMQFIQ